MQFFVALTSAAAGVAFLLLFPVIHLGLVALNFAAHLAVLGLQLIVSRFARPPAQKTGSMPEEPFVSIHVPAHNEPPEVLFQTLRSLAQLKWENYEVLVIDNNTSDPKLWVPVRDLCEKLGPKFRFLHVEGLEGFKAGAMNYARGFMNPRAEFIFVVDADYVVDRKALRTALRYFTDERIGLIQFPQDYRNIRKSNRGLALDYKHFFSGFMNVANALGCVPSTGTLALISVKALEAIRGFNPGFVTEDAELGLQLALNGYRSLYVNESIGAGLMPHELDGLKKQRWRWAFGNAQILRRQWKEILLSRTLSWKQKIGFFSHLTAWFNFNLIPSLSLIILALHGITSAHEIEQIYTVLLAGFTLATYPFLKYGIIHYSLRRDGHSLRDIWHAFATHVSLGWVFSASWIRCIFNSSSPFIRTNKNLAASVPGVVRTTFIELALGIGLMFAALALTITDFVLGPIAAAVMCAARFGILWVWRQTEQTFAATARLFPQAPAEPVPLTVSATGRE